MATSPATVPRQVTWGLLVAWAVHDLEELATMAPASRRVVARLRARYPKVPDGVWERLVVARAGRRGRWAGGRGDGCAPRASRPTSAGPALGGWSCCL